MSFIILPITIIWLELANAFMSSNNMNIAGSVLCAVAFGLILNLICFILQKNKWLVFAFAEVLAFFFCVEYFTNDAYSVFMSPLAIIQGAGGVANEFGDAVIDIVKGGILNIIILQLPAIAVLVLNICSDFCNIKRSDINVAILLLAIIFFQSLGCEALINGNEALYSYLYSYDGAVKNFGISTAARLDLQYMLAGVPSAPIIRKEYNSFDSQAESKQFNVSDIDFKIIQEHTNQDLYKSLLAYLDSLTPSKKNEYTALFKGKNLVLIAAESLSAETVREDITPCLYKMSQNGIIIEDYYQPYWGGSTTSGEASILLGRVPTENTRSMSLITSMDNSYFLANTFKNLGYKTVALHPGEYDYYDRYITHVAYGFDEFIARGSGLDIPYTWPGDDLAALEASCDKIISEEPFFLYFMSYSGHGLYNYSGNEMSIKEKEYTKGLNLGCSEKLEAYYAANHHFDRALEYLCDELEKAGKLDDTVFVITPDHYPYALQQGDAWKNDTDYLSELYGYAYQNEMERDHSCLIIYNTFLEKLKEQIVAPGPSSSIDIVPTVYNLFGVEYDSRLFPGRDLLSDEEALAVWFSGAWKSDKGFYDAARNKFIPSDEDNMPSDEYINSMKLTAAQKIDYSRTLNNHDFFDFLNTALAEEQETVQANE